MVAADAPDLPGLVVAKPLRAVSDVAVADVAVAAAPAAGGGLVVLAARLPAPAWLLAAEVDLDTPDAVHRLRRSATPGELEITLGWHRVRTVADVGRLDPELDGWAATRALLAGG